MDRSNTRIIVRQVRDRDELEDALRLVHNNYVKCGYMQPQPAGIRISAHYALPTTRPYIALLDGKVIATVSLFLDSRLGLPMDSLYADKLDELREAGRKIGEVGMLADRRGDLSRGVRVLLQMMKYVFHTARSERMDDLLITVNPKHVKFYQRLLCFKEFGATKNYSTVGNAPAVLLRIEISDVEPKDAPNDRIRELFFSPLPDGSDAPAYHMQREDLAYFFMEKSDIFSQIDQTLQRIIEEHYPGLKISELLNTPCEAGITSSA